MTFQDISFLFIVNRKSIAMILLFGLFIYHSDASAGRLEQQADWKGCLEAGGTIQSCARQKRGVGQSGGVGERSATTASARRFTPAASLSAAQENRINQLIGSHSQVQSNRITGSNALWYGQQGYSFGQDARNRSLSNQSILNSHNSRIAAAQGRADYAYAHTYHGQYRSYKPGCYSGCEGVCPPGFRLAGNGYCYR